MNLFLSATNYPSQNQLECSSLNISDTIERECLSVLHKLHDQVNGLQLVQVVVQPLAKLFNPASLATLAASSNVSQSPSSKHGSNSTSAPPPYAQFQQISGSHPFSASPPNNLQPLSTTQNQHHNMSDSDALSSSSYNNHSRSQSFASSYCTGSGQSMNVTNQSTSTSTYMMSPDTAQALIARLDTDRDVNWLMEIIGYGLSMPFSLTGEQDSVKDCCTIYCEWLASALLPYNETNEDSKYQQLSKLVPVPIRKEPNRYARKMLSHLYNVFLPRQPTSSSMASRGNKDDADALLTAVSRQAVLCHRVLRTVESIAHNTINLMDDDTWHHLLALLLTVNDKLLSPPSEPDDIGTQLHDRILGVLFDLMLLAFARNIPGPSLWRTFHVMCLNWRHRPALVEHWKRITSLLTKRIVLLPSSKINNERPNNESLNLHIGLDWTVHPNTVPQTSSNTASFNPIQNSISSMSYENLSQTWYRFLNLIGNPVELADANLISRTDEFYHAACVANSVLDPRQHPCLNVLPQIFLNSMLGLKEFIDSFIGTYQQVSIPTRRSSQADPQQQVSHFKYNPDRPKCNSILHVFGDWLFSAALIGSDLSHELGSTDGDSCIINGSITSVASSATATDMDPPSQDYSPALKRKQSHQSTASSQTSNSAGRRRQSKQLDINIFPADKITLEMPLTDEAFEMGQAEAMSLLCKIFSSRSSSEDISPAYLARFYLCMQHCLDFGCGQIVNDSDTLGSIKRHLLASVLMNSTALLQKDLEGINLLIPSFIKAIEFVLECNDNDIPVQPPPRQHGRNSSMRHQSSSSSSQNITSYELRRACIMTLVNLLAYPLHFKELTIRSCLDGTSPTTTFLSMRTKILKLLFVALQTETDSTNMQILFGGLSLAVHDLATVSRRKPETVNKSQQGTRSHYVTSNIDQLDPSGDKHIDYDRISQSSFVFNSSDGFLIKSLHVVCHLLINVWKHDNLVSLAALEVLTTIARIATVIESADASGSKKSQTSNNNVVEMKNEYMQTARWICDYISNQCSRPPPAHSRDMHSTIVAAYQCLSVWLYNHPYLLNDKNCINTVMEVIELGVSGQKSKVSNAPTNISTRTAISKGEKIMKPSSLRVREAAESLLNICLVRTCHEGVISLGPSETNLDELDIAEYFGALNSKNNNPQDIENRRIEAYKQFKYYSDEDSIIFGMLEGSSQDIASKDSVICLLRTPFGKHCWKLKFNYYSERSRDKIIANKTLGLIKRPFQQATTQLVGLEASKLFSLTKGCNKSIYINNNAKFFPNSIDNLPASDLDRLVANLDDYLNSNNNTCKFISRELKLSGDLERIDKLMTQQVSAEQNIICEFSMKIKRNDCEEPQQLNELETARLIVTQLGYRTALDFLSSGNDMSDSFKNSLQSLDHQSIKTNDTINVYYIRRGRTNTSEILDSVRERNKVSLDFFEWLLQLGQPVVIEQHKAKRKEGQANSFLTRNQMLMSDHGGSIFDGDRMSLHWGDMCQELTFLAPHRLDKIRSSKVIICWLECPDDMAYVPYETLLTQQNSSGEDTTSRNLSDMKLQHLSKFQDHAIYFVCPMRNGLFRINLTISLGRQWFALPLVDGMTVSKSILASLMRESILNLCRRKRLDADSYQPPHVRRRLKIQEICNSYKISTRHVSGEFYKTLFRSQ